MVIVKTRFLKATCGHVALQKKGNYSVAVSTITAILEPDADGSLRVPLPPELRQTPVKITATLEAVSLGAPRFGCLAGKIRLAPDFDEPLDDFKDYMG